MSETMTQGQILAMEPGRELDALVANRVMEWEEELLPVTPFDNYSAPYWCMEGQKIKPALNWSPSTSIAAAWEVVEKLKESNDCVTLAWGQDSWQCHVCLFLPANEDDEYGYKESMYDSPSAPEAICKAALLAVLDK